MIPFGPPPAIFPFFGYRSATRLRIGARALRARQPRWDHASDFAKIRALLSHFASREVPGLAVTLEIRAPDGSTSIHETVTDKEGYALFEIALDDWPRPAVTAWETVRFGWRNENGDQCAEGFVLAPGSDADLAVISDIDDTIIETGVTGGIKSVLRNWRRLLAQMPSERTQVPGTDLLYGVLAGGRPVPANDPDPGMRLPATHHPFFYVSSSPWNLFFYLTAFLESRGLPVGPLELRDWGLNRETFGSGSHGAHKTGAIKRLLDTFADTRFAMIGDDTQGDLVAFSHVAHERPGRIAAIFIRKAGDPHSAEELEAISRIEAADVPLWMGDSFMVGDAFLAQIGLSQDHEAERIVETAQKKGRDDTEAP
ncbi:phosphatase domain-containing protein [Croceicoccus mobilis]|uniref:Phosphatidate phosphatase APP1 catalytic domain-containing protein n=1 Tax=Croceicoccus mobilis TaxID=1703339 RepID=A0A917DRT9_9SPHN|nr:phosphatase domain-containing protein [Croceicoccus mobilis]GGD60615.1 hypothetical protein GCM10010990_07600 [Croceicoccus mobilis]